MRSHFWVTSLMSIVTGCGEKSQQIDEVVQTPVAPSQNLNPRTLASCVSGNCSSTELSDLLKRLIPGRDYQNPAVGFEPLKVWKLEANEKPSRYLAFELYKPTIHPSASRIRVDLFDESERLVGIEEFTTGWRSYLANAELFRDRPDGYPMVLLETCCLGLPLWNRQYYAFIDDHIYLVRIEDKLRKATCNRYDIRPDAGPYVVEKNKEYWLGELRSPSRERILRALVWLGGNHEDARANLARQLNGDEEVMSVLNKLAQRDDGWIREMALLARNPELDR